MLWNDLRDYLKKLDQLGMLERVRGAHWDLEIGVITELMVERGGPALLFDEVPDYPKSFGLAANLCTRPERTALALGLNHERPLVEMAEEWNRVIGEIQPIPMCEVYSGPVFDNTLKGGDVDLFHFPTPRWHDKDIDRYIGTDYALFNGTLTLDLSTRAHTGFASPTKIPAASSWNRIGTVILSDASIGAVGKNAQWWFP